MRLSEEEWKPAYGYEGYYEVSNKGNIRSLDRYVQKNGNLKRVDGKALKQFENWGGYMGVGFSTNGVRKRQSVHRLVLLSFGILPDKENCIVNHKNFNRSDNRLANLEWVSYSENYLYSKDNVKPVNNSINVPVARVSDNKKYVSLNQAGKDNHLRASVIWSSCVGEGLHKGEFKFLNENGSLFFVTRDMKIQRLQMKIQQQQEIIEQLKNDNINSEMNLAHMTDLYEQLQTQNGAMREALSKADNALNYIGISPALFDKKKLFSMIKEALKAIENAVIGTPTDYHNPADVEALKQAREALITLNTLGGLGFDKHRWIDEALATIDKAVGK